MIEIQGPQGTASWVLGLCFSGGAPPRILTILTTRLLRTTRLLLRVRQGIGA